MSRSNSTNAQLLPTLPWTIGALAIAFVPHALAMPLWISALFIVCAAARYRCEVRRGHLLPQWIRMPLAAASFIGVLASYGSINGVTPGSALLAVMASMKLLETRNQRDQFVLLFITLFLILATFLREQYLWSLPYLVGAITMTMSAWISVARRGTPLSAKKNAKFALRTLSFALPLLLTFWILFPRVPGPFWAIPKETGAASVGLSSSMSPGDISKLSRSNAVAFRARFDASPPPQQQLYWRAIVMDRFNVRTWSSDDARFTQTAERQIQARGQQIGYTVTMEATNQRWLFALDAPLSWQGERIYLTSAQTLQRSRPIDERLSYKAQSVTAYRLGQNLSERARRWHTRLPDNINPRSHEFALDLREDSASDLAYAEKVLANFREQAFFYTLSPPALGRNSIDEFLFDTRRGFCEHFASSFTYLMRAAGVPARVVAGYQGGEINPLSDYLIVRQSDAHAWSEIWLEGEGWVRVDPTAAVAPQRIEENLESALRENGEFEASAFDTALVERLQLTWDMIEARWNEWVLGFGPDTQRDFMQWLGMVNPDWQQLTFWLALIVMLCLALLALRLWWQHRPPVKDQASQLYVQLQKRIALQALRGEAPLSYAKRASANHLGDAEKITLAMQLYLRARYANDHQALENLSELVQEIEKKPS